MTLWVSSATWLPVRAAMGGVTLEYHDIELDARDVTDASFVYTVPPNATTLNLGGLLGSIGNIGASGTR
jgi:outer membrane lipoprotein-sorting protein